MANDIQQTSLFRLLIMATSQESSKRFVVIVTILLFIGINIVATVILVLLFTKTVLASQQSIDQYFGFWNVLVKYDFYIICFGIGAIALVTGVNGLTTVAMKKAEAAIEAARAGVPETKVDVQNVQKANIGKTTEVASE